MSFIYRGSSMLGVFQPGDEIFFEEISGADVSPGDVICFEDPDGTRIIHRAIRIVPGGIVTMGDNNPAPDRDVVATGAKLLLAVGFEREKIRFQVANGIVGKRRFFINRVKYLGRHSAALVMFPLAGLCGRCWGSRKIERADFAGGVCYFSGKRPVARHLDGGELRYARWYYRFFYRVEELDREVWRERRHDK